MYAMVMQDLADIILKEEKLS
jgi:hypothetical protein